MDADLVLIHGFWSSPATWDRITSRLAGDPDLAGMRIHAFGYESPKLRWPMSPARIPDYNDVAQSLPAYLNTNAPGATPIAIVTHSQGGLILQRFLAWMLTEGRGRELARIRLVIMLSCPNEGSEYLRSIRVAAGLSHHPQAGQLSALGREVQETRRIFLRQVVNTATSDAHNCRIPVYAYSGRTDNVVLRESAQSVFPNAGVLPGDHFSILDPDAPSHLTVPCLKRHLLDSLAYHDQANRLAASHPDSGSIADYAARETASSPDSNYSMHAPGSRGAQVGEGNIQVNIFNSGDFRSAQRPHNNSVPSSASRLQYAAGVFARFAEQYAAGPAADRIRASGGRTLLRARLVDVQGALDALSDAQLHSWPDEELALMTRTSRNSAISQLAELRRTLAQDESTDSDLRHLTASLIQLHDLVCQVATRPRDEGNHPPR